MIANKCPFIDGTGVYEARAMLVAYDGLKQFNDSCLIEERDEAMRKKDEKEKENILSTESMISIYPNPNNGNFTLTYNLEEGQTGKVVIYNTTGQLIGEYKLNNAIGKMNISNSNLCNGVYFYQLQTSDNSLKTGKIIIIK